ncbi:hypothetical protein [Corallibacter sp.]|uniref:hypothetical protein n=1 Tax=Corallibacter sp. TaxID=2038084 RepID=UPI003A8E3F17
MTNEISKLKKIKDKVIDKTERRDKVAMLRSDDWYNSKKGKKHEEATAKLAEAVENINDAIKELEEYIKTA